jgi:leucyl-tRNA synthetase
MMPHLGEECWSRLGHDGLLSDASWPVADPALAAEDTIVIPVQINGKKRAELIVSKNANPATLEEEALKLEAVQNALDGRIVKKVIVVPQRIVNVVA